MNADGVPPSSPGLRGTRYPGNPSPCMPQPQRGCARDDNRPPAPGGTALRFDFSTDPVPQGRSHCIRLTLGWRPISRWDMNHGGLDVFLCNANGVPPSNPGLRGTRYPGNPSPCIPQPQRGCARGNNRPPAPGGTALRFDFSIPGNPKVGLIRFGQPWAGGLKPVGLVVRNTRWASNVADCDAVHRQRL